MESTLEETVKRINIATRQFTRKQITWYKRFEEIRWFEASDPDEIAGRIALYFNAPPGGAP